MFGTVGNIKRNSKALELYGEFYEIDSEKKEKECKMLQLAWSNGPHPSQVKRRNWERRWPFLQILYFHGFQHLKYWLELLKSCESYRLRQKSCTSSRFLAKKAALLPNASVQPLDVSTSEKRFAALIRWIFSHPDIWRIITADPWRACPESGDAGYSRTDGFCFSWSLRKTLSFI
jgi:hypothetical protein